MLQPPVMTRQRRTRILIDGSPQLATHICAEVEALCKPQLISAPRQVLVMNKVRETARSSLFYLGEALLTECKVGIYLEACANACAPDSASATSAATAAGAGVALEVDKVEVDKGRFFVDKVVDKEPSLVYAALPTVGIGLILGSDCDRAYELAAIDAAFSLPEPLPELLSAALGRWLSLLVDEERRLAALRQRQRDRLETTRVEFDSMLTEEDVKGGTNG